MTYGKVNKAASSRKQGNHPFRHKLHTRMPPQSFFTSWTPNKKLLGRTALKRNTSFPRSNLRNKTWNLKARKKNSCPSTPYSMNEGSVAFSSHHPGSLAESTVGAVVSHRCAVTAPRLSWMPPAGHVFTAPHLPITHPSHPAPLREPREQRQKVWWNKPGWQHGWKNEETSDRAMFSCMQNNVVFIPSHHVSPLLTQVSGPSRHHVPQGEDAINCEQKLSKWWLVNNASKRLIRGMPTLTPQQVETAAFLHSPLRGSWACCSHSKPRSLGLAIQKQMSFFDKTLIPCTAATRHIHSSSCLASDLSVYNSDYKGITVKIPQISQQHQDGTCCNLKNEDEGS